MHTNHHAWEREYQSPTFVSMGTDAAQDVKDFIKWLKKKQSVDLAVCAVVDLGCGVGKNSLYCAERCHFVIGYDFSATAIAEAQRRATDASLPVTFAVQSIGEPLPLEAGSMTIALDVMTSHALAADERTVYLAELYRVLQPGGYAFVRTFVLDGDDNAKKLLQTFPGAEPATYVLPTTGMTEHVYTEQQLRDQYRQFTVLYSEKVYGYQRWGNRVHKRRYLLLYLQKPLAS